MKSETCFVVLLAVAVLLALVDGVVIIGGVFVC